MPKLSFYRTFYEKYNTSTITILSAFLKVKERDILKIDETGYDFRKAVVRLSVLDVKVM